MVVEIKHILNLDDIEAFEITCAECKTTISIPLAKCTRTTPQCPRCGQHWYRGGAADNDAILTFARAIADIKAELNHEAKFSFRVAFSGCDSQDSR